MCTTCLFLAHVFIALAYHALDVTKEGTFRDLCDLQPMYHLMSQNV